MANISLAGIFLSAMLSLGGPARAEDAEVKLNSADGTTRFIVQDNNAVTVLSADSDGNLVAAGTMTVAGSAFSVGGSTLVVKGGAVGVRMVTPQAALDVVSTGSVANVYAQIWRNNAGTVVASMSATGVLTPVPGDNLGDHTATQVLQVGAYGVNSSSYVTAAYYQVGGSTVLAVPGSDNTFVGRGAGRGSASPGSSNTFIGSNAGSNTSGQYNTFVGDWAGNSNTTGANNSFFGSNAAMGNTSGQTNSVFGRYAAYSNPSGSNNSVFGDSAGFGVAMNSFSSATIMGARAGYALTTGGGNILVGYRAGENLTVGSRNIIIGYDLDATAPTISDEIRIGSIIYGNMVSSGVAIGPNNTLPAAALDVKSSGTASNVYAQIWRDGTGVVVASMTSQGGFGVGQRFVISSSNTAIGDLAGVTVDTNSAVHVIGYMTSSSGDGRIAVMGDARTLGTTAAQYMVAGNFESTAQGPDSAQYVVGARTAIRRENAGVGIVTNAIGLMVDDISNSAGAGNITNTYGVYIGSMTGGAQTNVPYAVYSMDPGARSYFAGNIGIGTPTPSYRLVVSSGPGYSDKLLVVSTDTTEIFSVKGNGEVYTLGKFVGDGSMLTGISALDNTKLPLAGGTLTGDLILSGSSITVRGPGNFLSLDSNDNYGLVSLFEAGISRGYLGYGSGGFIGTLFMDGQEIADAMLISGDIALQLGQSSQMVLTLVGGKAGVGTRSPSYALDISTVAGDTDAYILRAGQNGILISTGGAIQTTGLGHGSVAPNARGTGAVDLQTSRVNSAMVAASLYSVLSGGQNNTAGAMYAVVSGGYYNSAVGNYAVAGGGNYSAASGPYSFVGGGNNNTASGNFSVIPGGDTNSASGIRSFAAGTKAYSDAAGAFTWADSQGVGINNTVVNRTLFKSSGGFMVTGSTNTAMSGTMDRGVLITGNGLVGISTGVPAAALDVVSTGTASNVYTQVWRNSAGVAVASMTSTGQLSAAALALTTNLPVTEGGTGASDPGTARTNLGLGGGFNGVINVRRADDTGPCNITIVNGIVTATTCM